MRSSGGGLLGGPIRVLKPVAAAVLLSASKLADTFGSAVFLYPLGVLFLITYSYLDEGRPGQ